MVLLKMLMDISLPKMRELLVMMMTMISPSGREVPPAESLYRRTKVLLPKFRLETAPLSPCRAPLPPSAHLLVYKSFWPRKNKERTFGTKRRRLEAEHGQELFCPPGERFRRGNFPLGGGNHHHHHDQQLSHIGEGNLHQHLQQHHLIANPSSSLMFNLVTGTIDWCLWVTSRLITSCSWLLYGLFGGRLYVQIQYAI